MESIRTGLALILLFACLMTVTVPGAHALPSHALPSIDMTDTASVMLTAPVEFAREAVPLPPGSATPQQRLEQARTLDYRPLTQERIGRGVTDDGYWIRFRLQNRGDSELTWVLYGDTSYLDHLEIFHDDSPLSGPPGLGTSYEHVWLSDREPFGERPVSYRKLAFRHTTAAGGATDVYLRAGQQQADSLSLAFTVQQERTFFQQVQRENLAFGAWYGTLASLLVIALLIAAVMRQLSAFYYALFLLSTMLMWALLNGLGYQYVWPESVWWQNAGFHLSFLLFSFLAMQFSRSFLKLGAHFPVVNRAMLGLQGMILGAVGLRLAGVYEPVLYLAYLSLLFTLLLPFVGLKAWRAGLRHARWYTAAWLVYSGGLLLGVINAATGMLGHDMDTVLLAAQGGSLVEALLLMVAIAERVAGVEQGRQAALQMAHQDPLTGLGNRRALAPAYQRLRAAHQHNRLPVFLVLIDLDEFKEINDVHGHEAGDRVLQNMAALLRERSRVSDVCIRLGGDEFVLLLQAESQTAIEELVERMRRQFADNPTTFHGEDIRHTFSAGIIPALDATHDKTPAELMTHVDEALKRAKRAGRNRAIYHNADT